MLRKCNLPHQASDQAMTSNKKGQHMMGNRTCFIKEDCTLVLEPSMQNFLKCQQVYELSQPSSPPQGQTTMKALNSQKQNLS